MKKNTQRNSKRSGVRESQDSAVGYTIKGKDNECEIKMAPKFHPYAFTITPSPHKKHFMSPTEAIAYKCLLEDQQKLIIDKALCCGLLKVTKISYEKTQQGYIHAHGILETIVPEYVVRSLVKDLGYSGKNNKDTDTVLLKQITNVEGWLQYCDKEQHKWTWDKIFQYLKDTNQSLPPEDII